MTALREIKKEEFEVDVAVVLVEDGIGRLAATNTIPDDSSDTGTGPVTSDMMEKGNSCSLALTSCQCS